MKIEIDIQSFALLDWQVYADAMLDAILEIDDSAITRMELK